MQTGNLQWFNIYHISQSIGVLLIFIAINRNIHIWQYHIINWFAIDDFHGTNYQIIDIATKGEILNIIVKILKPFILRIQKTETKLNLPPKKEIVINTSVTEQ